MNKRRFNYSQIAEPTLNWLMDVYNTFFEKKVHKIPETLKKKLHELDLPQNFYRFLGTSNVIVNNGRWGHPEWTYNLGIKPTIHTAEKFIIDYRNAEWSRLHKGEERHPKVVASSVKSENTTKVPRGRIDIVLVDQMSVKTFEAAHPEDENLKIKFDLDMIERTVSISHGITPNEKIKYVDLQESIRIVEVIGSALKKIDSEFKSHIVKSKLLQ